MSDQPNLGASSTTITASPTQDQRPAKAPVYMVFDMNQRGDSPRMHDVITRMYEDGSDPDLVTYKLFSDSGKGCPMPQDHAYKFLCDPAFKVIGPNGNRLMPIAKFDPSKPLVKLEEDEIIVKYVELSRESLFRRVKLLPGSENVRQNATVEELAAFLVNWRQKLSGMTDGERALAEMMASGKLDSMDEAGLDKMFGERKVA